MVITVMWFAELADRMEERERLIEVPDGASVEDVRAIIGERFPQVGEILQRCMIAVNAEYADSFHVLRPGDRVAFIPPVSGG